MKLPNNLLRNKEDNHQKFLVRAQHAGQRTWYFYRSFIWTVRGLNYGTAPKGTYIYEGGKEEEAEMRELVREKEKSATFSRGRERQLFP